MKLPQSKITVPMPPVKPPAPAVRIGYREGGEGPGIDEAVVRGVASVHIEALDDNMLWIGITRLNAERIVFTVTRARGYLRVTQTEGADDGKASNLAGQPPRVIATQHQAEPVAGSAATALLGQPSQEK